MNYQLLIAVEVFDFAQTLPRREQLLLWKRFREIGETPHRFVDYGEPNKGKRPLDVHLHTGFAIFFWEDAADRHVKILHVCRADR